MNKIYLILVALLFSGRLFAISPISGPTSFCDGTCIALTDATSGGTWVSSDPAIGTIGTVSGVLCGFSPGTTIVTYTVGSSYVTITVACMPLPGAISGASSVCVGSSITETDGSFGGSWSAGGSAATCLGGVITGVSAGSVIVTYVLTDGCFTARAITVDPLPAPITGPSSFCNGSTATYTDATGGGTWTSSALVVAGIVSTTGLASGFSPGTTIFSYTLPTGCSAQISVTVTPTPSGITGASSICSGTSTPLSDATGGGIWSSSNPAVATVGTSTGVATGVTNGTCILSYSIGGCRTTHGLTVLAGPAAITGTTTLCDGGTTTLGDAASGGYWTSSATTVAAVNSATGAVTGVSPGTSIISYTMGCGTATTVVMVNPLPVVYTVTGGGPYCMGATGVHVGTSGSTSGITYTLYNGTTMVTSVTSTGSAIDFGLETAAGAYAVTARNAATGCTSNMTGTATITVEPLPSAYSVIGGGGYCVGGVGDNISLANSDLGVNYTLMDGSSSVSTLPGAGSALDFGAFTSAGTYTISATEVSTGCTSGMTGSAVITINPLPTIAASSATGACGSTDTVAATGGVSYSWAPSAGLSCATCDVATVDPSGTVTYTVTGTDGSGCSNTATVALAANRIYGNITFSSTLPDTLDTKVWLIQFNSSDSSIIALDSTVTCTSGTTPYFEFDGIAAGNYMVKAKLIYGDYAGTSGYLPTYSSSTPYWYAAATAAHTSGSDNLNINMLYGTVPAGPGFISGYVISGAGRGTSTDIPATGMLIYLEDASSHVLTFTSTDGSGYYAFAGLGYGTYIIHPEAYDNNTIASALITLNSSSDTSAAIDFKQHTTSHVISPYVLPANVSPLTFTNSLGIFPNPASSGVVNIKWENQAVGTAMFTISDIVGREVFTSSIDMNTHSGMAQVNLDGVNDGIYLVTIRSASVDYSGKLIIQK